jgi:hypothetical protein
MRKSAAPSEASIPPAFVEKARREIAAVEQWADDVVAAWMERRDAFFEWESDHSWLSLECSTEGRSITWGECLVTRASDGFLAIVSGKRYRDRWLQVQMQVLQNALFRREVPGIVLRPPHAWRFVDADDLDRWYAGAKRWHGLSPEAQLDRYLAIAVDLVDAYLGGDSPGRYNDGYRYAEAFAGYAAGGYECILARSTSGARVALLSGRRYARGSFNWGLREAIRIVLGHRGIPFREIKPAGYPPTTPETLNRAWRENAPHLL